MKEQIKHDVSLEALSKKSFKKYLKMLIKDKSEYLDNAQWKPHTYPHGAQVKAEYCLLCQVLDDYKYFRGLKKDKKRYDKGDSCRI